MGDKDLPKCGEGGIKAVYLTQMPINLDDISYMSELSLPEAEELKEPNEIKKFIIDRIKFE